jgi:putative selenium metabolism hydrolase
MKSNVDPGQILNMAEKHRDFSSKLLAKLVEIPSISGREEKIIRFLEKTFSMCGADEVQVDGFGNVLARLGSAGPVIAFDGHVDTVDIGQRGLWDSDPYSARIKDGRLFGRGSVDQKGGLAAMISAMKILREISSQFPFTLFFVGSIEEEVCDGLCWQYIVRESDIIPDIVVLTEPSSGTICRGQRGRMEMEIMVDGVSCHGSTPERGDNAIYKIGPILAALEKLNSGLPADPFLGKGTITATRVRSGAPSLNAVADFAGIYLDRRLTAGETPESAWDQVYSMDEVRQVSGRVQVASYEEPSWRGTSYPTLKSYPSWALDPGHHLLDYAQRCHKELFKTVPEINKWDFSTNGVATMGMFKIPTFGFGPGDERLAHAPNEAVLIDDVIKAAAFYAWFPWIVTGG